VEIEACLLIKTEEAGALQADERVMNINEEADLCSLTWSFRRLMHTILELKFQISGSVTNNQSLSLPQNEELKL
jgi:hypothetical protein